MKFSLSWLREYLEFTASLEEICLTLNRIGLEVESIEDPAQKLAGFRVATILEATPHPDADRLRICRVNAGSGFENIQVVCGAPNARTGLNVIFAPPGTYIPGSDITIKAGKIRGQESGGMLCSLRELGLGEETDGIAELSEDAPIGQSYVSFADLDDPVIEIAITPNRGDALSIRGIARDLAAASVGLLKSFKTEQVKGEFPSAFEWKIEHEACPYILGRVIKNVKNGKSPEWLKRRVESVGISTHSLIVDITNYVMLSLGRPLHAYDAGKLSGASLVVTSSQKEHFRALNGQDYLLGERDLVIADEKGIQSLAGIIGAEESSVTEETQDIFLEVALFDPVQIALTGRSLALQTDARYRFERGVNQADSLEILDYATSLILKLCGGAASMVTSAGQEPQWQRKAALRFERLKNLGGIDIAPVEAVLLLEKLGFDKIEADMTKAVFAVPSWRNDIASGSILAQKEGISQEKAEKASLSVNSCEAEADLVEEVLRLYGLDTIPPQPLPQTMMVSEPALKPHQIRQNILRRVCAGRGLMETIGFSFVSEQDAAFFEPLLEEEKLLNPITSDLNQLRPTNLIPLLRALSRNLAQALGQNGDAAFFEIGPVFGHDGHRVMLSAVRGGVKPRAPGQASEEYSWKDAKLDLYAALKSVNISEGSLSITSDVPSYYHPGRSGVIKQGPKTILGRFGELHPKISRHFAISGTVALFELNLDSLPFPKIKRKVAPKISSFQPVRRDFAFLAASDVKIQDVLKAVKMADRQLIEDVRIFDIFEGGSLPEGYRSLGIEVTLQPYQESLTEKELDGVMLAVEKSVKKATGAELRR